MLGEVLGWFWWDGGMCVVGSSGGGGWFSGWEFDGIYCELFVGERGGIFVRFFMRLVVLVNYFGGLEDGLVFFV